MEPLYCGHFGDLVKCAVYCPVEPLYCGQLGDLVNFLVYQCSSQRQPQRAVLSQRSKQSCGLITFFQPHQKENCIPKSGGAPLFHSLARTLYTVEPLYCGHLGYLVKCILYTVEPLYCGHLGYLVKCTVYSGTPLLWTPWVPGEVSCIQWNPSIVDTLGTWRSVLYTVEPLYCGHLGYLEKCPVYSGTPLLWIPWVPGEVSCIQWNPSIVDTLGTW